ncbi:MAG: hypothetical protein ACRCZO_03695, partial [Cetobacterium sp.]
FVVINLNYIIKIPLRLTAMGLGHSAVSTAILSSYKSHIIYLNTKSYGGNPPLSPLSAIPARSLTSKLFIDLPNLNKKLKEFSCRFNYL